MNNDLISRKALKEYARKVMCEEDFWTKVHLELFENIINNTPTVDIKTEVSKELAKEAREIADENYKYGYEKGKADARPQGEWVTTDETDEFYGRVYKCTHCGEEMLACGCRNFCPYCGAEMKGKE